MSTESDFELPTDPAAIKRIRGAIEEIVAHERFIKDKRENIKDVKTMLKEEYDMPTSLAGKLVKAFHDDDYQDIAASNSVFELVRETVLGDGGLPDDAEAA